MKKHKRRERRREKGREGTLMLKCANKESSCCATLAMRVFLHISNFATKKNFKKKQITKYGEQKQQVC
jgi:hypothetical protein